MAEVSDALLDEDEAFASDASMYDDSIPDRVLLETGGDPEVPIWITGAKWTLPVEVFVLTWESRGGSSILSTAASGSCRNVKIQNSQHPAARARELHMIHVTAEECNCIQPAKWITAVVKKIANITLAIPAAIFVVPSESMYMILHRKQ